MDSLAHMPIMIIAILVAITVHEWAHAFAAKRLGDDTAEMMGRLTLNPIAHIDPLGAILFLIIGFGWAKPVPVDARNFRHPIRDNAIVALAGPLSNLVLAFVALSIFVPIVHHLQYVDGNSGGVPLRMAVMFLQSSITMNLALMAFNLLPIPPLDGSNILRMFIPWHLRNQYEDAMQYGPWILLGVIVAESFVGIPILSAWVRGISDTVLASFTFVLGFLGL